jgi:hypothetical protein
MNLEHETNLEPSGEFAAAIRDFRSAVEYVAARETARPVSANWLVPARKRQRSAHQRMALGWTLAALLCIATLPFSIHSRHVTVHPVIAPIATAPAAESDSALLEQVDSDVSESVPSSLAPLTALDSWNTTSANTSSVSSANGTTLK